MWYYDENGEMSWTDDAELARRQHVVTMVTANKYPLKPNAAGALYEKLGPVPVGIGRTEALRRIRRVLTELGLPDLPIEAAVEVLDDGWKLVVTAGRTA